MYFYFNDFSEKIEQTYINILQKDLELREFKDDLLKLEGKKIRSSLHFLFSSILGYKGDKWQDVGAVLEMVHNASLLHDDVLDESKLRRGKKSFNEKWGDKNAILMGDFLLSCALKHLSSLEKPSLILSFSKAISRLSISEILQSRNIKNSKIRLEDYLDIIKGKTGSLFSTATHTAFLLTESSHNLVDCDKFSNIGLDFGVFFQIRDDYLDYFGKEEKNGKSIWQDFFNGIYTYPIFVLMEVCLKDEIEEIHSLMREEKKDGIHKNKLLSMFDKYSIQDKVKTHLNKMLKDILDFLDNYPSSNPKTIILDQIGKLSF